MRSCGICSKQFNTIVQLLKAVRRRQKIVCMETLTYDFGAEVVGDSDSLPPDQLKLLHFCSSQSKSNIDTF